MQRPTPGLLAKLFKIDFQPSISDRGNLLFQNSVERKTVKRVVFNLCTVEESLSAHANLGSAISIERAVDLERNVSLCLIYTTARYAVTHRSLLTIKYINAT
ncbi:hypothetical protein AVEN_235278-1 [Araneus ventricosus]|uniref:Uncharacterized protein n=1 Tax=Araneus ventricosus TaxID=182803 RepID=A0A4Y2A5S2_ARAVE|nr:hypothetical protein AVEN_235278-1 [Araneus ventricosus]